jgi:dolichol kinase
MPLSKEEINRKLLHILSGTLIPAGILYIPLIDGCSSLTPAILLGICAFGSVLLEYLRFHNTRVQALFIRLGASVLRQAESHSFTGSTYIFLSAFICSLLFIEQPHVAAIALSLFILGDAAAALIGISFGRIKIGKKSLEGSAACFLLGMLLFLVVYPHVPLLLDQWQGKVSLSLMVVIALANTLFELFPLRLGARLTINDNLSVPLITGTLLLLLQPVLG